MNRDAAAAAPEVWQRFEPLGPQAAHALGVSHLDLGDREPAIAAFPMR